MRERMIYTEEAAKEAQILAIINEVKGLGGEAYQSAAEGQIGYRKPVQEDTAPMLTVIAKMKHPQRMLEFGTAYGLSGLQLLMGAPGAYLDTIEFDDDVATTAQEYFDRAGTDTTVYAGTSGEFLNMLEGMSSPPRYDLVIFDHDKEMYLPDFKRVEPFLAPGAVILADNVIDKIERCGDMVEYAKAKYGGLTINTAAGLYYGRT